MFYLKSLFIILFLVLLSCSEGTQEQDLTLIANSQSDYIELPFTIDCLELPCKDYNGLTRGQIINDYPFVSESSETINNLDIGITLRYYSEDEKHTVLFYCNHLYDHEDGFFSESYHIGSLSSMCIKTKECVINPYMIGNRLYFTLKLLKSYDPSKLRLTISAETNSHLVSGHKSTSFSHGYAPEYSINKPSESDIFEDLFLFDDFMSKTSSWNDVVKDIVLERSTACILFLVNDEFYNNFTYYGYNDYYFWGKDWENHNCYFSVDRMEYDFISNTTYYYPSYGLETQTREITLKGKNYKLFGVATFLLVEGANMKLYDLYEKSGIDYINSNKEINQFKFISNSSNRIEKIIDFPDNGFSPKNIYIYVINDNENTRSSSDEWIVLKR